MFDALKPLPLPVNPTFADLLFRRHEDGVEGHLRAFHDLGGGRTISVTIGGSNWGESGAPFEVMLPDGEVVAPITSSQIDDILKKAG